MREIHIVFSSPKRQTIVTKMIKFFQKTKFSHCIVTYGSNYGKTLVYESKGLGERIIAWDNFLIDNSVHSVFKIKPDDYYSDSIFFNHLYSRIGLKYDYKQLIGYLWIIFRKTFFNKDVKNPLASGENSTTCNEAVMIIMRDIFNFKDLNRVVFDSVDLRWLFDFCKNNEKLTRMK